MARVLSTPQIQATGVDVEYDFVVAHASNDETQVAGLCEGCSAVSLEPLTGDSTPVCAVEDREILQRTVTHLDPVFTTALGAGYRQNWLAVRATDRL